MAQIQSNKYDQIINFCSFLLNKSPIAEKARSILQERISPEMQKIFNFGYFPDECNLYLLYDNLNKSILDDSEIIFNITNYQGENCLFSPLQNHNIIMPYKNVYGNTIAVVGRTCQTEKERRRSGIPKYKNSSFKKSKHLFGLNEAKFSILDLNYVYLVEGQLDMISAFDKNIKNVVCLGSANLSFDQLALILRYTNNIKILLDNDQAGEIGASRIIEKFGRYANFQKCKIPNGFKDLDEFLTQTSINNRSDFEYALIN